MRFSFFLKNAITDPTAAHSSTRAANHPANHRSLWRPAFILLLCLSLGLRGQPAYANPGTQAGEPTSVILVLREQARLTTHITEPGDEGKALHQQAVLSALKSQAVDSQFETLDRLQDLQASGKIADVNPLWVANAITVTASPEVLGELANLPGVAGVVPDYPLYLTDTRPANVSASSQIIPQANLSQVGAQTMWQQGFTGKGVVVANVDSGVSLNNSDLKTKWRGGSNSWYDTHHEHATPVDNDLSGHGTATMGIMVSTSYGMAPDAKWIAVKMFSDAGYASVSDALMAFQWLLDPDGNPLTADAPDVVNNSWSENIPGCVDNPVMHSALKSLLSAGILPVFSAGNLGPGTASDPYPSNYPEVIAVGAIDSYNRIQGFSSRGPSTCRPAGTFFPDLVAPGLNIESSGKQDAVPSILSGTSFSAPHVAGALALLLNAFPNLSAEDQRSLLRYGAIQVNGDRPNDTYGYGRLNVWTTYNLAFYQLGNIAPYLIYMPVVGH